MIALDINIYQFKIQKRNINDVDKANEEPKGLMRNN